MTSIKRKEIEIVDEPAPKMNKSTVDDEKKSIKVRVMHYPSMRTATIETDDGAAMSANAKKLIGLFPGAHERCFVTAVPLSRGGRREMKDGEVVRKYATAPNWCCLSRTSSVVRSPL